MLHYIYNPHSDARSDPDESGVQDIEAASAGRERRELVWYKIYPEASKACSHLRSTEIPTAVIMSYKVILYVLLLIVSLIICFKLRLYLRRFFLLVIIICSLEKHKKLLTFAIFIFYKNILNF